MEVSIGQYGDIIYKRWIFQQAMFDYHRVFTNITGNTPYGTMDPRLCITYNAVLLWKPINLGMLGNRLVYHASFSSIGCKHRGLGFYFHGEKLVDHLGPSWMKSSLSYFANQNIQQTCRVVAPSYMNLGKRKTVKV